MGEYDQELRHISRIFPEEFAKIVLGSATDATVGKWLDTQVTARERRLDKTLEVFIQQKKHLLHVEFQTVWEEDVPFRIYEYQSLLRFCVEDEAHQKSDRELVCPVRSVVILLKGKQEKWERQQSYQVSWANAPFCGVQFEVEAIYQRTLAELEAMQSLWWLIFAPLTINASNDKLTGVVDRFKREAPNERAYEELTVALAILAGASTQRDIFRDHLKKIVPKELVMENWIYTDGVADGEARGQAKAVLLVMASRKIKLTQEQKDKILACKDLAQLDAWLVLAATATKSTDLFATSPATKAPSKKPLSR